MCLHLGDVAKDGHGLGRRVLRLERLGLTACGTVQLRVEPGDAMVGCRLHFAGGADVCVVLAVAGDPLQAVQGATISLEGYTSGPASPDTVRPQGRELHCAPRWRAPAAEEAGSCPIASIAVCRISLHIGSDQERQNTQRSLTARLGEARSLEAALLGSPVASIDRRACPIDRKKPLSIARARRRPSRPLSPPPSVLPRCTRQPGGLVP